MCRRCAALRQQDLQLVLVTGATLRRFHLRILGIKRSDRITTGIVLIRAQFPSPYVLLQQLWFDLFRNVHHMSNGRILKVLLDEGRNQLCLKNVSKRDMTMIVMDVEKTSRKTSATIAHAGDVAYTEGCLEVSKNRGLPTRRSILDGKKRTRRHRTRASSHEFAEVVTGTPLRVCPTIRDSAPPSAAEV